MAFDSRTEKNLKTLLPEAELHARRFLQAVLDAGYDVKVLDGTRTFAEQDELFAQGRTKPGKKVTNARGGQSNHNYGIAWDIGLFKDGDYLEDSPLYRKVGKIGRELGLEWGGDWKSITDEPHYQIRTGRSVAQLLQIVRENGGDIKTAAARKAIGALVPPLDGSVPAPAPEEAPPVDRPVAIVFEGRHFSVDSVHRDSRVWVSVDDFTDYFGGEVVSSSAKNAKLRLNGEEVTMVAETIHGRPFVKFADINAFLGFQYVFDGKKMTLEFRRLSKPTK